MHQTILGWRAKTALFGPFFASLNTAVDSRANIHRLSPKRGNSKINEGLDRNFATATKTIKSSCRRLGCVRFLPKQGSSSSPSTLGNLLSLLRDRSCRRSRSPPPEQPRLGVTSGSTVSPKLTLRQVHNSRHIQVGSNSVLVCGSRLVQNRQHSDPRFIGIIVRLISGGKVLST